MQQMKSHKDLDVWRAAVRLAKETYQITNSFPKEEQFGLGLQLRRSTVSIASNIAEGAARQTRKELIQHLYIAAGSASELDTQLELLESSTASKKKRSCIFRMRRSVSP